MIKKVLCLLPVHKNDNPQYFKDAVVSILNQKLTPNLQLTLCFCIDGDLTSELEAIIADSKLNESIEISCIKNKYTQHCIAANLNFALEQSVIDNYDFIARMDADDISKSNRFSKQVKFLENNQQLDVIGCWVEIFECSIDFPITLKFFPTKSDELIKLFNKGDPFFHSSVMFRTSFFKKVGLYDGSLFSDEDTELWARAIAHNIKMGNVPELLHKFRQNNGTLKRRKNISRLVSYLLLRFKINHQLGLGFSSYFYCISYFIIHFLPVPVVKLIKKILL